MPAETYALPNWDSTHSTYDSSQPWYGSAKSSSMSPLAIGGALLGGAFSALSVRAQNKAAAEQAKRQMDFQERMSNTAHVREVADLRAAGLNPILSANKGASSPSGAQAPVQNAGAAGIATALQLKRLQADLDLVGAQTTKTGFESAEVQARTRMIQAGLPKAEGTAEIYDTVFDIIPKNLAELNNLLDKSLGSLKKGSQAYMDAVKKLNQNAGSWNEGVQAKFLQWQKDNGWYITRRN
nr:MAG: DNA pilot protein [Microvirus sp.]